MKLIATKSMSYNTRRLLAGDHFEARDGDARLLIAVKKAVASVEREPGKVGAMPPALAAKVAQTNDRDALGKLRADAESLGVAIDNRWGAKRLQTEIDAALNKLQPAPAAQTAAPVGPAEQVIEPPAPTVEHKSEEEHQPES